MPQLPSSPLLGARIWLSGAVPEDSTKPQCDLILSFVQQFSRSIFEGGGYIVHGSHPSFVPTLLVEANRYQENDGRKDALTLAVSRYWSKNSTIVPLDVWRNNAIVYETPEASGEQARDESLVILRKWMVARCDAVVVVGGKWWKTVAGRSGIPIELDLAIERGLPCFLLGGFGGAAQDFAKKNPHIFSMLKNGLDEATNLSLSIENNTEKVASYIYKQLEKLPLVRGRSSEGNSFRILSLDGGGLKGTFTASVLATWEEHTHLRIVDYFDLIAGTSTGGILAIGLGLGLSGQNMLNFYKNSGPIIFPISRLKGKLKHNIIHLFRPKYAQTVLLKKLEEAYYSGGPKKYLRDSLSRLLIPTYHAISGLSHVFRTPHHPDLTADSNTEAAYAALATATAPTYFAAARIANMIAESKYFDGGVWANSPVMAAVIEAVCFLGIPLDRIDLLSVGTTDEPFTVRKHINAGLIGWAWKKKILDLLMNVQQESSIKLTQQLVGDPHFLRINTITVPGNFKLDSPLEIEELADLGNRIAQQADIISKVKSRFLNGIKVTPWEKF